MGYRWCRGCGAGVWHGTSLAPTLTQAHTSSESAESLKRQKYRDLEASHHFVPIAIETSGVIGAEARTLLADLGRRLAEATKEQRSHSFLLQRLLLAVQRGNAASIMGTIEEDQDDQD